MNPKPRVRQTRYRQYPQIINQLYKSKKTRVYTGVTLSIFTVAFFTFFTIRPTLVTIASLLKEIETKRETIDKLDDKIRSLDQAQIEYQKIEEKLYLVDESLPVTPDLTNFVRQLEVMANTHSLIISSLNFKNTVLKTQSPDLPENQETSPNSAKLEKLIFSISVQGNYQQTIKYLEEFFSFRRLISVESYDLTPTSSSETQNFELTLNATAYFYGP